MQREGKRCSNKELQKHEGQMVFINPVGDEAEIYMPNGFEPELICVALPMHRELDYNTFDRQSHVPLLV